MYIWNIFQMGTNTILQCEIHTVQIRLVFSFGIEFFQILAVMLTWMTVHLYLSTTLSWMLSQIWSDAF